MRTPSIFEKGVVAAGSPATVDDVVLHLLPWLALRHDFSDGSFAGKGEEQSVPVGFLTAQAGAILEATGLRDRLPHIVRTKLDIWPAFTAAELAGPASGTPLALVAQANLRGDPAALAQALAPFLSSDGGYMLKPGVGRPGLMAAAHHLLVEVRPAWFALRARPAPSLDETVTRHFLSQLFPAFST